MKTLGFQLLAVSFCFAIAGCYQTSTRQDGRQRADASTADAEVGGQATASPSGGSGSSNPRPSGRDGGAANGGDHGELPGQDGAMSSVPTDKLDLLLVVDNSESMAGAQQALKAQFPTLLRSLVAKDLHVGVVSTDMGVPGVEYGSCHADGGDDGRLQHVSHGEGCQATYPLFLKYAGDDAGDRATLAQDLGCIATLGTGGCGFEQQLESPLKALWPSVYTDANGNVVMNPIKFLATTPQGTLGRGDVPAAQGGNLGFLRNDKQQGLSVIAIVVVTDEDDCSVRTTEHLWPNNLYPNDSPYKNEVDINLRCFNHPDLSYDVLNRYYKGFRGLRPGNEGMVVFAAITGVPADLVDADRVAQTDFSDSASRSSFYDAVLNDSRMQLELDPSTKPGSGSGNLRPVCTRTVAGARVYPARRIATLAQDFGENGMLQSICEDDFEPAMTAIASTINRHFEAP